MVSSKASTPEIERHVIRPIETVVASPQYQVTVVASPQYQVTKVALPRCQVT